MNGCKRFQSGCQHMNKAGRPRTAYVSNTFGYLRKPPVPCFQRQTQGKWFSLNGSPLCVRNCSLKTIRAKAETGRPTFHCDLREQQLQGCFVPETRRGSDTPWEVDTGAQKHHVLHIHASLQCFFKHQLHVHIYSHGVGAKLRNKKTVVMCYQSVISKKKRN